MKTLYEWACAWNIPAEAIKELIDINASHSETPGQTESDVMANKRLLASKENARLWRNNVGAGKLENGSFIRWGLCNESRSINTAMKSADLIGIYPRRILPDDVGTMIGQFWSVECKRKDWNGKFNTDHEKAQLRWALIVRHFGGRAEFTS